MSNPVGYADLSDERCILKLNEKEKITVDEVNSSQKVFAPSYIITKEKNGIVTEITVDSFSLITKRLNP